jgi:hypothetical protein
VQIVSLWRLMQIVRLITGWIMFLWVNFCLYNSIIARIGIVIGLIIWIFIIKSLISIIRLLISKNRLWIKRLFIFILRLYFWRNTMYWLSYFIILSLMNFHILSYILLFNLFGFINCRFLCLFFLLYWFSTYRSWVNL